MHLEEPIKRDFTYTECILLLKILANYKTKDLTGAYLARLIGMQSTSPTFNKILKYLVEKNIVTRHPYIGPCLKLEINEDLLTDLLDEQKVILNIYDYLHEYHIAEM